MKKFPLYFLFIIIITSCNSVKHVAEGDYLLTKNIILVDSIKNKSVALQKFILQKTNAKFIGIPFELYVHNLGNHDLPQKPSEWGKKNKRSYNFIKKVFSEKQSIAYANLFINLNKWFLKYDEPAVIDRQKINTTTKNLLAYHKTQGYFKTTVDALITRKKGKKATVSYFVNKGKPTLLDEININIESQVLDSIFKANGSKTILKKGNQYNDQVFRNEAKKTIKLFRNNGIFHFSEAAIGFYVDSTRTDYRTNVEMVISKNRLIEENGNYVEKPYKVQTIKEVNIITDYAYSKEKNVYKDKNTYQGINFYAIDKLKYSPKFLAQSIFLKPGNVYKDTLRNLTRNHLKSLNNFKTTNIQFDSIGGFGNALRMNVFLTPIEKYSLGFESELTNSNIRNIGVSGKFSIINRNVFKGSELLKISLLGSWFNSNNGPGWELGGDISFEIPRFVMPFGLNKLVPKEMSPKTLFSVGSSIQKNIGLDRKTFTIQSNYRWQFDPQKTIELEILNTQYIQNLNINNYFGIYNSEYSNLLEVDSKFTTSKLPANSAENTEKIINFLNSVTNNADFQTTNPAEFNTSQNILNRYNIITSDFLIPTLAYSFTYNSQTNFKDNNFSFFKIRVANSGNFMGLISQNRDANNKKTFFDIPLAQYFKTDLEYKRFWSTGLNSVLGIRTFLGVIITYDNASIPFTKSYFAGGSNDIRAWKTYELGPGATNSGLEYNIGSLKFLTSIEYRFDVFNKLKGALFIDAGNIWDISGSPFVSEKAKPTSFKSLENIAVGSGFGMRFDFDYLIFRFDVGFKTYEPYLTNNRWFKNYNFTNAAYQIGINYPF